MTIISDTCSREDGGPRLYTEKLMGAVGTAVNYQLITLDHDDEIPEHMKLSDTLKACNLKDTMMREIVFSKGEVKPGKALPGKDLVLKNCGDRGCIVFVIRRPGCSYCREQALYLKYLATHEEELLRGFKLCGVVKELCADSEGLIDFHTNFFPFPIYHDDDLLFYKALGDRKVGIIEAFNLNNPFGRNKKRVSKLPGNFAGEGFLRGGVLLFDHKGEPAYMFEEQTGNELPVGDIVTAARTIRKTYAKSFVLENIRNSQ